MWLMNSDLRREYWYREGAESIKSAMDIHNNVNTNVAKNLIMVIGDGMGIPTITG